MEVETKQLLDELENVLETHRSSTEIVRILVALDDIEKKCTDIHTSAVQLDNTNVLIGILTPVNEDDGDNNMKSMCLNLLAEWCKSNENRQICSSDSNLVLTILKYIQMSKTGLSACRALGNMSYENSKVGDTIGGDGIRSIITLLYEDSNASLIMQTKRIGLLLNLLNENCTLQIDALQHPTEDIFRIMRTISMEYLYFNMDDVQQETLRLFLFQSMISIADLLLEHFGELNLTLDGDLANWICDVMIVFVDCIHIVGYCLQIIHKFIQENVIMNSLRKRDTYTVVISFVNTCQIRREDVYQEAIRLGSNIIVHMLADDECMPALYADGQGHVYKDMKNWLEGVNLTVIRAGILAIGNFARKAKHCIQIVNDPTVLKSILRILPTYSTTELCDPQIQYACLSTLKNLLKPKETKPILFKNGLLDILFKLMNVVKFHSVAFKLLATIRFQIHDFAPAALCLIMCHDVVTKLVEWYAYWEHGGIRAEISRLLSWMVLGCQSHDSNVTLLISIRQNYVKCIVDMLESEHESMRIDSLLAIRFLSTLKPSRMCSALERHLLECDLGGRLNGALLKSANKQQLCVYELIYDILYNMTDLRVLWRQIIRTGLPHSLKNLMDLTEECSSEQQTKIVVVLELFAS